MYLLPAMDVPTMSSMH